MGNFCLKKYEKSITDIKKGRIGEGVLLVNDRECFALFHFIFTHQN